MVYSKANAVYTHILCITSGLIVSSLLVKRNTEITFAGTATIISTLNTKSTHDYITTGLLRIESIFITLH